MAMMAIEYKYYFSLNLNTTETMYSVQVWFVKSLCFPNPSPFPPYLGTDSIFQIN